MKEPLPAATAESGIFTRDILLTTALALVTLLAVYICFLIVQPFFPAIAFAVAIAVATNRPNRWLAARVKSRTTAAGIAVVLVALLIIVPVSILLTYIVKQGVQNISDLRSGGGLEGLRNTLEADPRFGGVIRWLEEQFDIGAQVSNVLQALGSRATVFLAGSVAVVSQLVITLFVLFFLYRDSKLALQSVRSLLPLSQSEADRLLSRIASTIYATVNGSITVATIQALLAGAMYWILGVPAAALWGAATFIMALVPVFGTVLIWGPVALYLALVVSWVKALILIGWGILAVGTIDNVLYPYLVGDKLRMHTVPTFFAIIGGITVFGPAGLILGPLTLALAVNLLDVWDRRTEGGRAAEEQVTVENDEAPRPGTLLKKRPEAS